MMSVARIANFCAKSETTIFAGISTSLTTGAVGFSKACLAATALRGSGLADCFPPFFLKFLLPGECISSRSPPLLPPLAGFLANFFSAIRSLGSNSSCALRPAVFAGFAATAGFSGSALVSGVGAATGSAFATAATGSGTGAGAGLGGIFNLEGRRFKAAAAASLAAAATTSRCSLALKGSRSASVDTGSETAAGTTFGAEVEEEAGVFVTCSFTTGVGVGSTTGLVAAVS